MKNNFKKRKSGFTLVETLVAISIFTVALIGIMSVLGGSIADTNYAKRKVEATYLAQEGIEYLRNRRDTFVLYDDAESWETFNTDSDSLGGGESSEPSDGFTRIIKITSVNVDEVTISSTVSWNQGSGQKSITLSENLYNWMIEP